MNPCPCGYLGDVSGNCGCSAQRVAAYRSKISGPLLDRIDLHVTVGRPPKQALRKNGPDGERSSVVADRVSRARATQLQRSGVCNARLRPADVETQCWLDQECLRLLEQAVDKFSLSARSYQRVLRVARTIADLAKAETITPPHIAEALSLRTLDRSL
jgi:magnesium chelatase family protein